MNNELRIHSVTAHRRHRIESGQWPEIFSKDTLLTEAFSFQDALNQCDRLGIISK